LVDDKKNKSNSLIEGPNLRKEGIELFTGQRGKADAPRGVITKTEKRWDYSGEGELFTKQAKRGKNRMVKKQKEIVSRGKEEKALGKVTYLYWRRVFISMEP